MPVGKTRVSLLSPTLVTIKIGLEDPIPVMSRLLEAQAVEVLPSGILKILVDDVYLPDPNSRSQAQGYWARVARPDLPLYVPLFNVTGWQFNPESTLTVVEKGPLVTP